MNCPVCPKQNIPEEMPTCPQCNTDLTPLRRIQALNEHLQQQNQSLNSATNDLEATKQSLTTTQQTLQTTRHQRQQLQTLWHRLLAISIPVALVLLGLTVWQYTSLTHLRANYTTATRRIQTLQNQIVSSQPTNIQITIPTGSAPSHPPTLIDRLHQIYGIEIKQESNPATPHATSLSITFQEGLFLPGSAQLTERSSWRLAELAHTFAQADKPHHYEVEGWADNRPYKLHNQDANPALAHARATTVANFMRSQIQGMAKSTEWRVSRKIHIASQNSQSARTVRILMEHHIE